MRHEIEDWFTHPLPTADQLPLFEAIRSAGKHFAEVIVACCPPDSQDALLAVHTVRQAVMLANAAIACHPQGLHGTIGTMAAMQAKAQAQDSAEQFARIERRRP